MRSGKGVGRAHKRASDRQRARGRCRPCPRGVTDTEDDVFGDDVKMTVNGKRRVWAGGGGKGEALAHPGGCRIQKLLPLPTRRWAKCGGLRAARAQEGMLPRGAPGA